MRRSGTAIRGRGDVHDGEVWGRGALDMKGEVAANAVAMASLARDGFAPRGDLLFVAAADEEVNDGYGLSWLCAEHPEAVRADYALNEGGGERVDLGGRQFYLVSTAEKMSAPFLIRTRGRSGHASMPGIADNALLKAARLVERIGAYQPELTHTPETEAFFRAVTGEVPPVEQAVERAEELHALFGTLRRGRHGPDLRADDDRGVAEAERRPEPLRGDGRLAAAAGPDARRVRAHRPRGARRRATTSSSGSRRRAARARRVESPLWDAIDAWVQANEPGAGVAPICLAGFTDSHWMREAFGTVSYGFFPMRAMEPEVAALLIHSANERIPVDDLELAVDFYRSAAAAVLA